ncbi:MAG: HlyD family secretion protein [Ectothiorhodospiraceae bacterium]|jgi:membrane fusion protein (multidrug efflux system)
MSEQPSNGNGSRRKRAAKVMTLLVAVATIGGGAYWYETHGQESTDDAFVDAAVARVSPRVSGTVVAVHVTDNQRVEEGDLLFEIDPSDYRAAVEKAEAALRTARSARQEASAQLELARSSTTAGLAEARSGLQVARAALERARADAQAAEAQARQDERDAARLQRLFKSNSASRQQVERAQSAAETSGAKANAAARAVAVAKADVGQAQARLQHAQASQQQVRVRKAQVSSAESRVAEAEASLKQARLNLSWTKIRAPHAGRVTSKSVEVGDTVQPGQSMTALVFGKPWIKANFKETQLTRMRPGQPVTVEIDAYPDVTIHGHVDSIQQGTGARFSLLPPENATGNFVKVVQRLPVKIVLDDIPEGAGMLAPGMSAVPTVNVSGNTEKADFAAAAGHE